MTIVFDDERSAWVAGVEDAGVVDWREDEWIARVRVGELRPRRVDGVKEDMAEI